MYHLQILVEILNRPNIYPAPLDSKVNERKDDNDAVDQDVPVHERSGWVGESREEDKYKRDTQIHDRDAVHPDTSASEREFARNQGLVVPPLDKHARNADDVG